MGARSEVGQSNWTSENGTNGLYLNYPASDSTICQQMAFPLTYDDGINLLPKRCDQKEYFGCEVQRKNNMSGFEN